MVELFKRSKFFLSVASKMSYDDGIVYTENNIVSYLAELEEHICSLITYSAFKKDDPNAAISAIPLNQLNSKEFGKKELDVSSVFALNLFFCRSNLLSQQAMQMASWIRNSISSRKRTT